ncbi:MAG: ATP synthase protein I [Gammaproteobacteria bacterium]
MKKQIVQGLAAQILLAVVLAIGIEFFHSGESFVSVVAGSLAAILPNGYIGYKIFRQSGAITAHEFVNYAYRSQLGKWVMTGMIFVLIFTADYNWDPLSLFAGYCVVAIAGGFIPLIFKSD